MMSILPLYTFWLGIRFLFCLLCALYFLVLLFLAVKKKAVFHTTFMWSCAFRKEPFKYLFACSVYAEFSAFSSYVAFLTFQELLP